MLYVLDTHALIWYLDRDQRLSERARQLIAASALAWAQRLGEAVRMITRDERIAACGLLECVW